LPLDLAIVTYLSYCSNSNKTLNFEEVSPREAVIARLAFFASRSNPAKKFKHSYWIAARNGASNDGLTEEVIVILAVF